MIKSQKGFIFPLTLLITSLFIIILLYQCEAYLTEKRFLQEREELETLENLKQIGLIDITRRAFNLEIEQSVLDKTMFYGFGYVEYSILPVNDHIQKILMTCYTKNERSTRVILFYDHSLDVVTHWVEG